MPYKWSNFIWGHQKGTKGNCNWCSNFTPGNESDLRNLPARVPVSQKVNGLMTKWVTRSKSKKQGISIWCTVCHCTIHFRRNVDNTCKSEMWLIFNSIYMGWCVHWNKKRREKSLGNSIKRMKMTWLHSCLIMMDLFLGEKVWAYPRKWILMSAIVDFNFQGAKFLVIFRVRVVHISVFTKTCSCKLNFPSITAPS